jgi:hypothetical protein
MTGLSKWLAVLGAVCVLGAMGCAGTSASAPPPAERAEVRPPRPHPGAEWVPGHWTWKGRRLGYVWVAGHWSP